MRRFIDILISLASLILLSPFFLFIAIAIRLDSRGSVFHRGERMGKDAKIFYAFKFRTMVSDAAQRGGGLTIRDDPRVTRVGKFLRRTKLDELPQLNNVLMGEMSLVGPRPEDPRYLPYYSPRQKQVLSVQPGITSLASIQYRDEEYRLAPKDWERTYISTILPAKLEIELDYLASRTWWRDIGILISTISILVVDKERGSFLHRAVEWFEKRISWVLIDIPLIVVAYILAIAIRSINASLAYPEVFYLALGGIFIYLASNYFFGIYHRFWRYASGQEVVVLFSSIAAATLLLTLADLAMNERTLPLGVIWLGSILTFIFLAAVRYRRKLSSGARQMLENRFGFFSGSDPRVLIVGAGEEGQLAAWQIQNRMPGRPYRVVGYVDDDRKKHGMRIHNVQVFGGRAIIPELCTHLRVELILLAIPSNRITEPRQLLELCRKTSARLQVLPGMFDWLKSNGHAPDWIDLTDEDLMQRRARESDRVAARILLAGRDVMVTGAAGSIGSELCRQIVGYAPRQLWMLDTNESDLHDLNVELKDKFKETMIRLVLCDVADPMRLEAVFRESRPHIVFHAAAYKHVPILQDHPEEAVRVNVLGTQNVHALAKKFIAERFILISSDKAVNPVNVLGMTKLLGEWMVSQDNPNEKTLGAVVRFGNVLGSRGSALNTFEKQIASGGPVTITHADMTRYFMSIDEAVNLVIQAAAITRGGEVFLLDMGEPVSILDMARRVIRAQGLRPDKDIPIEFIGLRPGEKMSEELVASGEEKILTAHPSIFCIQRSWAVDPVQLDSQVKELARLSRESSSAELRRQLESTVESLRGSVESLPN